MAERKELREELPVTTREWPEMPSWAASGVSRRIIRYAVQC